MKLRPGSNQEAAKAAPQKSKTGRTAKKTAKAASSKAATPVKAQAAKATFSPAMAAKPGLDAKASTNLDTLWDRRYAELVPSLRRVLEQIETKPVKSLDADGVATQAESLFILQHRTLAVVAKLSMMDAPAAKKAGTKLLQDIAARQTTVFRSSQKMLDAKDTRPLIHAQELFRNTYKKPGFLSPTQVEDYYLERLANFVRLGGDLSSIKTLDQAFLKDLKSNQFAEFVVTDEDVAKVDVAEGAVQPGHGLLAGGRDALSAGTFRVFKDDAGNIDKVVVGTYSGHFRAPVSSLAHFARHLIASGVPPEKIVFQDGEAAGAGSIELIHMVLGLQGADEQRRLVDLQSEAFRWTGFQPTLEDRSVSLANTPTKEQVEAVGGQLAEARATLAAEIKNTVQDGLIIDAEPERVSGDLEAVLRLAEQAGNRAAYYEAMGQLRHFADQKAPVHRCRRAQDVQGHPEAVERSRLRLRSEGPRQSLLGAANRPAHARRGDARPGTRRAGAAQHGEGGHGRRAPQHRARHLPADRAEHQRLRDVATSLGRTVTVQIDLAGPKIRLGKFENPTGAKFNDVELDKGDKVTLTNANVTGTKPMPLSRRAAAARHGSRGRRPHLDERRPRRAERDQGDGRPEDEGRDHRGRGREGRQGLGQQGRQPAEDARRHARRHGGRPRAPQRAVARPRSRRAVVRVEGRRRAVRAPRDGEGGQGAADHREDRAPLRGEEPRVDREGRRRDDGRARRPRRRARLGDSPPPSARSRRSATGSASR